MQYGIEVRPGEEVGGGVRGVGGRGGGRGGGVRVRGRRGRARARLLVRQLRARHRTPDRLVPDTYEHHISETKRFEHCH